jgi:hypothetical protein
VQELVRFDPDAPSGDRLRVWDRIAGDLVEREVEGESTSCAALSLTWVVRPDPDLGAMLRLARDVQGGELLPTLAEAKEAEGRMRVEETERRRDAEQRIRELEEELRRLRGEG